MVGRHLHVVREPSHLADKMNAYSRGYHRGVAERDALCHGADVRRLIKATGIMLTTLVCVGICRVLL